MLYEWDEIVAAVQMLEQLDVLQPSEYHIAFEHQDL